MPVDSFEVQCKQCHTAEHYKVGFHDNEDTIEKAIDNFQGKTQIQIRSIIKKHTINSAQYGYVLFTCPECNTLFNLYTAKIEYDNIMLFKSFHKCRQCNTTLVHASETLESYICQQCKQIT